MSQSCFWATPLQPISISLPSPVVPSSPANQLYQPSISRCPRAFTASEVSNPFDKNNLQKKKSQKRGRGEGKKGKREREEKRTFSHQKPDL